MAGSLVERAHPEDLLGPITGGDVQPVEGRVVHDARHLVGHRLHVALADERHRDHDVVAADDRDVGAVDDERVRWRFAHHALEGSLHGDGFDHLAAELVEVPAEVPLGLDDLRAAPGAPLGRAQSHAVAEVDGQVEGGLREEQLSVWRSGDRVEADLPPRAVDLDAVVEQRRRGEHADAFGRLDEVHHLALEAGREPDEVAGLEAVGRFEEAEVVLVGRLDPGAPDSAAVDVHRLTVAGDCPGEPELHERAHRELVRLAGRHREGDAPLGEEAGDGVGVVREDRLDREASLQDQGAIALTDPEQGLLVGVRRPPVRLEVRTLFARQEAGDGRDDHAARGVGRGANGGGIDAGHGGFGKVHWISIRGFRGTTMNCVYSWETHSLSRFNRLKKQ